MLKYLFGISISKICMVNLKAESTSVIKRRILDKSE